jgi:DNA-binding transcriptional LysR family regulator
MATPRQQRVTITVPTPIAAFWLIPRMAKLQQRHPAVDLQLVATNRLCDLAREQIDLAIRYGTGEWRNLEVRQLMPELYFPVVSATFLRKHDARNPAELLKTRRIISNALHPDEWTEWCTAHGLQAPRTSNMISLNSAELVVPLFRDRAIGKAASYLVRPRAGISSAGAQGRRLADRGGEGEHRGRDACGSGRRGQLGTLRRRREIQESERTESMIGSAGECERRDGPGR